MYTDILRALRSGGNSDRTQVKHKALRWFWGLKLRIHAIFIDQSLRLNRSAKSIESSIHCKIFERGLLEVKKVTLRLNALYSERPIPLQTRDCSLPGTQAFVNFLSLEKALAETTTMTNMPMIHDSFVKDFLKVMRFVHGLSCVWERYTFTSAPSLEICSICNSAAAPWGQRPSKRRSSSTSRMKTDDPRWKTTETDWNRLKHVRNVNKTWQDAQMPLRWRHDQHCDNTTTTRFLRLKNIPREDRDARLSP